MNVTLFLSFHKRCILTTEGAIAMKVEESDIATLYIKYENTFMILL